MHCLNKPDGALQNFSRAVTRYCACETAPQIQRELWTIFYPSAMDSWILLTPILHWWSYLSCSLLYIKTESGPLCFRDQTPLRFMGEIKSLHSNSIERCGKEEHVMFFHDTVLLIFIVFSSIAPILFLTLNSYTESWRIKLCIRNQFCPLSPKALFTR